VPLDFETQKVMPTFICAACGLRRFEHALGTKCLFDSTLFTPSYMVDEGSQFMADLRVLTPKEARAYEVYCRAMEQQVDLDRGK
jgi:hypothetical protein